MEFSAERAVKIILALAACVTFAGCATYYNPATQRREAVWLSIEQEKAIARNTLEVKLKDRNIVSDARAERVMRRLTSSIESPRIPEKNIVVYEDEDIQAFTPGGGFVALSTGLLRASNEDELAAVIAHEIGHDEARHVMKRVEANLGAQALFSLAYLFDTRPAEKKDMSWQYFSQAAGVIYTLAANGFSRRDEYEADRLSILYMYRAGYDPNAIITFFEKLKSLGRDTNWVYFLRSHPYLDERIEAAREEIKKYEFGSAPFETRGSYR